MENKVYSQINEILYSHKLENGLQVQMISKPDFFKTFVYLGVHFGSLTSKFVPLGEQEMQEVPLGIAHFLEHKLFANADGTDAANLLAELGLEANAYTDYIQTVYLFNGAKNIDEGIKILLDFVQNPYFTYENVASEKNIIIQELKMYLDIPSDRLHNGLMN
ncbi:MAG: insulinase family protein, partial [Bacilli bacterium]|nr:insulinase family protein [Bacilli bacterium]